MIERFKLRDRTVAITLLRRSIIVGGFVRAVFAALGLGRGTRLSLLRLWAAALSRSWALGFV